MQEFRNEFNVEDESMIDRERAESEFGDLLFSLINYARFIDINPEDALEKTNQKIHSGASSTWNASQRKRQTTARYEPC